MGGSVWSGTTDLSLTETGRLKPPVRPPHPSKQASFCIVVAFVFHNLDEIFISSTTGYALNMPEIKKDLADI